MYTVLFGHKKSLFGITYINFKPIIVTNSIHVVEDFCKFIYQIPDDKNLPKNFIENKLHTKLKPCTLIIGGKYSTKRMRIIKSNA